MGFFGSLYGHSGRTKPSFFDSKAKCKVILLPLRQPSLVVLGLGSVMSQKRQSKASFNAIIRLLTGSRSLQLTVSVLLLRNSLENNICVAFCRVILCSLTFPYRHTSQILCLSKRNDSTPVSDF